VRAIGPGLAAVCLAHTAFAAEPAELVKLSGYVQGRYTHVQAASSAFSVRRGDAVTLGR
jgi:hypothetical protein